MSNAPARDTTSEPSAPLVRSALALAYATTLFLTVIGIVTYPGVIGHTEHLEAVLYATTFGAFAPVAIILANRRLGSIPPGNRALVAGVNVSAVVFVLVGARLLFDSYGASTMRAVFLVGAEAIVLGNLAAARLLHRRRRRTVNLGANPGLALLGALLLGGLVVFAPEHALRSHAERTTFVVAIGLTLVLTPLRKAPRALTRAVDVLAIVLIVLVASDVNPYGPDRFDQDFYLGPVNAVLHGQPMLVTTYAQYGVGVMYFLAAVFKVISIGYGEFQLVNSVLTCIEFLLVYAVLRLAARDQRLAVVGTFVCLVAKSLSGIQPVVQYGSTGPLRFGLTWGFIFLTVYGASRSQRGVTALDAAAFALLAISAVWSLEAFVYTGASWVAVEALGIALEDVPARQRLSRALRRLSFGLAAVAAGQVLFSVATRIFGGSWPDWSPYLASIRLYGWGGFGDVLIAPWSLGFAIAGLYFLSVVALVFVVSERRAFAIRARPALIALAGTTGYGIASFTYFLGRSDPNNLHHIAPPAIVVLTLWVGLILRVSAVERASGRVVVLVCASLMGAAIVGAFVLHPARAFEGSKPIFGPGLRLTIEPIRRLIDDRPDDESSIEVAGLLHRFASGDRQGIVVLGGDIQTSALIRAHRGNALPVADPVQDALLPTQSLERVDAGLARIKPGATLFTEAGYLHDQSPDAANAPPPSLFGQPDEFQTTVLSKLLERFHYQVRLTTESGLVVIRLGGRIGQ